MRALTIAYILLACTVAGFSQTTATYDNVRARQQLTLNGHTLTSVLQTIDSLSTHAQGVTAKAVYDYIATKYSTVSAGTGIDVVKAGSNYTISLDTLKRLHFRTDSTYSGGVGTMRWNLTDGTLDLGLLGGNVTLQLGQESVQRVKHADNSGLTEGKAVYIVGSSGDNLTVRYAQANTESTSANTFGVMTESASGGDKAFCTTFGLVRNINTSNLTEGGMVWLSKDTAGALTAVRPTAPNHGVEIGFCVRKHATTGVIFVTIQNGYELRELHDVYAPSPLNNQGLLWKSANSRWEAAAVDTSNTNEGLLTVSGAGAGVTIISNTNNYSSSFSLIDGAGIYINETGNNINIQNTGDLETDNEGKLGVSAGAANNAKLITNTIPSDSVTIAGGTGILITENPAASGGTITVTNSAPDQTVTLTNGGGVGVTGTYPSFTLTATDQSASNEGTLGVGAGTATSSVITSNTSGASGVTLNAGGGISISETTSSNGGSITLSATDQSISNEGILGVAINPGADAWLRSNTSTANDIGLVATNNMTITSSNNSNGGQIVFDSKAQIDTFSLSGQTLRASLLNDGVAASSVTLPIVDVVAGTNITVSKSNGVATVSATNGSGSPAGSTGEIQFNNAGAFAASANLAWDISNVRLNIGTPSAPTGRLNVKGGGTTSSTVNLRLTDSGNTELLKVLDNGSTNIGTSFNWDNANGRLSIGSLGQIGSYAFQINTPASSSFRLLSTGSGLNGRCNFEFSRFSGGLYAAGWQFIKDDNDDLNIRVPDATPVVAQKLFYTTKNVSFGDGVGDLARVAIRGSNTAAGTNALLIQNGRSPTPDNIYKIENNGKISYLATNTAAGTTGAQTINMPSGTVNFGIGATSLVVTNSLCTTASIVLPVIRTNDATAMIKNVVPAAGSFTINLSAAATAETSVGFFIIN